MGQTKGHSIADSALLIKKACEFEGEIVFDTKYKDGDPMKVVDGTQFKELFKDFVFFDHYQGILKTVEYYKERK